MKIVRDRETQRLAYQKVTYADMKQYKTNRYAMHIGCSPTNFQYFAFSPLPAQRRRRRGVGGGSKSVTF